MDPGPLIWALLACSVSEPGFAGQARDTALPYTPSSPTLSGEQAAAAFQALLDQGLPTTSPIVGTWMDLVDRYGDAECPDRVDYSMLDAPFGCEATSGAYFSGMTAYQMDEGGQRLLCDAYVLTPEGARFDCGGEAIEMSDPFGHGIWTLLIGSFGWVDQPAQEGGSFSAALTIQVHGDGRLGLDGGLGHGGSAIHFEGLEWHSSRGVVAGGVSVHSSEGWYRSVLGPAGCGAWIFEDGGAVGQGCVDLSGSLSAWLSGVGQ